MYMNENPLDKAIKTSAEDVTLPPSRKSSELLPKDSDLFEALIYRIEDEMGYLVQDWNLVKVFMYANRDDWLVNVYEVVPPPDGVLPIFDEYRIRSFRAYMSGDDDQTPDKQILSIEAT